MPALRHLFALFMLIALAACGGGNGGGSGGEAPRATVQATGTVVDDQGVPLAGATVKVLASGTGSVTTDSTGAFALTLDAQTPAVLRVEKAGFTSTVRATASGVSNANVATRVVMLPVAVTLSFDAAQAAVLRVPGSAARVDLAANSLVRQDGQPLSGAASVALTPIDPSADVGQMPGLMVDATSGVPIESLGALAVNFTDASGAPLNLASGQSATIRIPATPAAGATLPATYPLYHLNETTGRWVQEGTATLQTDVVSGAQYYEGTVSHFSVWNADLAITRSSVDLASTQGGTACTVPAGLRVQAVGIDYNGATQPDSGNFFVRASSRVRLLLLDGRGQTVDSLELNTAAAGASIRPSRCLASQSSVQLSGQVVVSSGSLAGYRVQISGAFPAFTLPIDGNGRYATPLYSDAGSVNARLVRTDSRRDLPDTQVSATVAGSDVALPNLTVADTTVSVSGCLQGWSSYRQGSAQVSLFRGNTLLAAPFTVSETSPGFAFSAPINSTLTLRITPPDASLAERSEQIVVGSTPSNLGACLALPRGPQLQVVSSGSGLVHGFDASTSTAGDAALTSFAWDFGDGLGATGPTVSHTYAGTGNFVVTLTVTDALGQQSTWRMTPDTSEAQTFSTLTAATTLDAGERHACVIRDGSPWCWGQNYSQNLGRSYGSVVVNGNHVFNGLETSGVPVQSSIGISSATAVVAGAAHTCALLSNGTVRCWGSMAFSGLGDGVHTDSAVPVTVSGIGNAKALTGGGDHLCALLADGTVWCWGDERLDGPGKVLGSAVPTQVTGITTAVAVAATGTHFSTSGLYSCAVLANGGVRCWGDARYGKLGNGSLVNSASPVAVAGISTAVAIATGNTSACALLGNGQVQCWGEYSGGVLGGLGVTAVAGGAPVTVPGISNAVAVSLSSTHACALLADATVACWGGSARARGVASPAFTNTAAPLPGLSSVAAVSVGEGYTCALLTGGGVRCLGTGRNGVLGTGGQAVQVNGVVQNPPAYPNASTPQAVVFP